MPSNIHQTNLANGATLVTDRAPHFESVAIAVSFRVGSMHEHPDQAGLAHLLEHLMFRGSETRPGEDIHSAIETLGGQINAFTDEDSTTYTAQVLKEDLGTALEMIADMVRAPRLDPDDIDLEKQIIERENCRGCYNCSMRESYYELSYNPCGLHNPIIGHAETLEAITRDNLEAFHKQFYVGANLIVAVSRDVEHAEVAGLMERAFGGFPQGSKAPTESQPFHADQVHISHTGDTASLRLGYDFSHLSLDEKRALEVFIDILGGHGQSLLMQELREKRGLVYGVWAADYEVGGNAIAWIDVNGEVNRIREVVDVMAQTMRDAAQSLPDGLFTRQKRRGDNGMRASADDLSARANRVLCQVAYRGKPRSLEDSRALYNALTEADLLKAGKTLLAMDPTIITAGSTRHVPKFTDIREMLKLPEALQVAAE